MGEKYWRMELKGWPPLVYTVRGKHLFRDGLRIQRKSQGKLGKSQGDFFGKFLPPMNQDPSILAIVCQTSLTSYFSLYLDIFLH